MNAARDEGAYHNAHTLALRTRLYYVPFLHFGTARQKMSVSSLSLCLHRKGPPLDHGKLMATEIVQAVAAADAAAVASKGSGGEHDRLLQSAAMDSAAEKMRQLGMSIHWQSFSRPGATEGDARYCRSQERARTQAQTRVIHLGNGLL